MNWFERYGIVGMFFIIMTGMWFFCLFPDSYVLLSENNHNEVLAKYVAGFCGLGFLPIGYLIVIFGQFLYYNQPFPIWNKIHCKYWSELPPEIKKYITDKESLSDKDLKDESKMEAILTYYDRMCIKDLENNKFLSAFATKRYDVIAINRGLYLATPVSLLCAIGLRIVSLNITPKELLKLFGYVNFSFEHIHFSCWLAMMIISVVILWTLRHSSSALENQIIEIGKRQLSNIELPRTQPNANRGQGK